MEIKKVDKSTPNYPEKKSNFILKAGAVVAAGAIIAGTMMCTGCQPQLSGEVQYDGDLQYYDISQDPYVSDTDSSQLLGDMSVEASGEII